MNISSFSDNQQRVIRHSVSNNTSCLAAGAIRSGKTIASSLGFAIWTLNEGYEHSHAIIGQSVETIMRNVGFDIIQTYNELGAPARLSKDFGTRIVVPHRGHNMTIWIIGASNILATKKIQGSTLKGLFVDEALLVPESFFMQAWGRLSVEGAKMWCTYNRENPRHWFKRNVEDRVDKFDGKVIDFAMSDNPSLSKEVLERYDASYFGHFHDRLIKGKWAGASGLIFPTYHDGVEPEDGKMVFVMDWAQSGILAALAIKEDGMRAHVKGELYHNAREEGEWTVTQARDAILAWIKTYTEPANTMLWMDPATNLTFKRMCRNKGLRIRNADNDVVPGIITTRNRLENRSITIGDCPKLKEEMDGYQWDDKRADKGEDVPVKEADHGCDDLRYYAHSTGKMIRYMKPTTTEEIGLNHASC